MGIEKGEAAFVDSETGGRGLFKARQRRLPRLLHIMYRGLGDDVPSCLARIREVCMKLERIAPRRHIETADPFLVMCREEL